MADYRVIDAEQLNADLTIVADAIRAKGGTTEQLPFPLGMKSAVEAIQSGGSSVQIVTGEYTTDGNDAGSAYVYTGFSPDVLIIELPDTFFNNAWGVPMVNDVCVNMSKIEEHTYALHNSLFAEEGGEEFTVAIVLYKYPDGFTVATYEGSPNGDSWSPSKTYKYTAIKYT